MTKKEFAATLDSALKAVRKEYGFTQEKMAAVLGISKKTLVEIEKGRSSLGWTGAAAFAEAAFCRRSSAEIWMIWWRRLPLRRQSRSTRKQWAEGSGGERYGRRRGIGYSRMWFRGIFAYWIERIGG